MYRQGDILLLPQTLPSDGSLREVARVQGRIVLAYGEATGHAHAIADPSARLLEHEGKRFLAVSKTVQLEHEEHAPITLPAGTYAIRRQVEYYPKRTLSVYKGLVQGRRYVRD